jgi:toxin HigB-1
MILGYKDKRTQAFVDGELVVEFQAFERQAWKRIEILDATTGLADLRALPSNLLEPLRERRQGQFSIRINDKWRTCFEWADGDSGASSVEIIDYH